jgi:hypothetical protein
MRRDAKLVSVYYCNTDAKSERFIGATLWGPGMVTPTGK